MPQFRRFGRRRHAGRGLLAATFMLVLATLIPTSQVAAQTASNTASAQAAWGYRGVQVFGDSLSDTGNDLILTTTMFVVPAIPPSRSPHRSYYDGRFSNGPVAIEMLWRQLSGDARARVMPSLNLLSFSSRRAVSYAFGGSGSGGMTQIPNAFPVPGLQVQVQVYGASLFGFGADRLALHVVWTGANDYLLYGATNPATVVGNIETGLRHLYTFGARHFLVPNLPDLGTTPLAQAQGAAAALSQLTVGHNAALASMVARLQARYRDARFTLVDLHTFLNQLAAQQQIQLSPPALEILAPGTSACLLDNPRNCRDVPLNAALPPLAYWDVIHPTTAVHGLMAQEMLRQLAQ